MRNLAGTTEAAGDLFGNAPGPERHPLVARRLPLEMRLAGTLCRQIRRKQAPRDKRRIAHLICLNLLAMLRRGS